MIRIVVREGYDFAGIRLYIFDCDERTLKPKRQLGLALTWNDIKEEDAIMLSRTATVEIPHTAIRSDRIFNQLFDELSMIGQAPKDGETEGKLKATKEFAEQLFKLHEKMCLR
jgi:hypothetical protein